jgi:hypothetical protein
MAIILPIRPNADLKLWPMLFAVALVFAFGIVQSNGFCSSASCFYRAFLRLFAGFAAARISRCILAARLVNPVRNACKQRRETWELFLTYQSISPNREETV